MFLNAITGPFLGSLAAGLGGRWLGSRGSGVMTVLGLGTSVFCSVGILLEVLAGGSPVVLDLGTWFQGSTVHVSWLFSFDSLTACMMVTVTTVSFCVHIYSLGYMQNDPHLPRFMSYLSLFTGGMLILVAANDLVTLLVGWELIGVCSYLLIGFWFHRLSATKAAQKAVLVNRVSDTALMVGLMASWWYVGSADLTLLVTTSASGAQGKSLAACGCGRRPAPAAERLMQPLSAPLGSPKGFAAAASRQAVNWVGAGACLRSRDPAALQVHCRRSRTRKPQGTSAHSTTGATAGAHAGAGATTPICRSTTPHGR